MRSTALLFALAPLLLQAASPRFTYDDIEAGKFKQKTLTGVRSMSDGERYTIQDSTVIAACRYDDASREILFDGAVHGVKFDDYMFSPDELKILLATNVKKIYRRSFSADWLLYDRETRSLSSLTETGGEQQPLFSPDGAKIGFVKDNDLYVLDASSPQPRRITSDGERGRIINGLPDWVYEEEFAINRAFCFSPDGKRIAWLRFDESRVKEYTLMRYEGRLYPEPYIYKYPKAGEENSQVGVFCFDLETGTGQRAGVDTGDCYVPRIGFTPEGGLWLYRVNRRQNVFEVVLDGVTVYREECGTYVERPGDGTVTFLPGGRMVVMNESSGRNHLYLYEKRGGQYRLRNAVTSGDWDVASLVDIAGDRAYYLSGEGSPLRRNLCSVGLDGKGKRRLTPDDGVYRIAAGKEMRYFIGYFSNSATPLQVSVRRGADGAVVRMVEDNADVAGYLEGIKFPQKEFFTLPAADGTPLNGYMIKPEGFDPARRYPVLMTQYGGPGSQQVLDRWTVDWEDVMVQHGYVVVCVDPRGTGMRGEAFRKSTYGRLGRLETADQTAAARWVASQPWADPSRIGIYGWSYGGFMALNCILHGADIFKMAIAVAPVSSWRFYDTVYTEIYNGLPQDNPEGYDDASPLAHAQLLRGKLLMIHGAADDNVHPQNSYEMASALMRVGKRFDLVIYPDCNHSMLPGGRDHVRRRMIDYTLENL